MITNQQTQILCLLFSDLEGYSKLKDNRLKNQIVQEMLETFEQVKRPAVQLIKTMGDGLMVASFTPLPIAETALNLRDTFRNTDWKAKGFPADFLIRIGLHMDEMIVHYREDGTIADVIGTGVDKTARIEPITEPNAVFCSVLFYQMLQERGAGKIKGVPQGQKKLAKQYGEMELFELRWMHEADMASSPTPQPPIASSIPMPRIKKSFTDKERKDFLHNAFGVIQSYFDDAVRQLEATVPGAEATITSINSTKFICEIYRNGELKTRGKIWSARMAYSSFDQIYFAQDHFDTSDDNSYNDSISVEDDGQKMYLKASFSTMFARQGPNTEEPSSPEQIAEYLWLRLTQVLER